MENSWHWCWESGTLTWLTLLNFLVQWTLWVLASLCHTEKFYDLAGSTTFILLAYLNYQWNSTGHPRQAIQTSCIFIWALRLGLFLITRILKAGKDRRFDKIRSNPARFFFAWTIQGTAATSTTISVPTKSQQLLPPWLSQCQPRVNSCYHHGYLSANQESTAATTMAISVSAKSQQEVDALT
nr:uncharacterized protein LOC128685576 [Cherax quadricarinatus]